MDLSVAKFVHQIFEMMGSFLTPICKVYTYTGYKGLLFIFTGLIFLLFRKSRKGGTVILIALAIGALFTNILLKNIVQRPRPYADTTSLFYEYWVSAGSMKESEFSFPSGHSTVTAGFATAIFLTYDKKKTWPILISPIIMAFTRIYFSVHYFTDVLAGLCVGTLAGIASYYIVYGFSKTKWFNYYLNNLWAIEKKRNAE